MGGDNSEWLRYLQDHASKRKQSQSVIGVGRHWGVIGRDRFRVTTATHIEEMSDGAYAKFLRAFQRLCTPVCSLVMPLRSCDVARWEKLVKRIPFGRRVGRVMRRGRSGKSIWFTRPASVARLVSWARSEEIDVTENIPAIARKKSHEDASRIGELGTGGMILPDDFRRGYHAAKYQGKKICPRGVCAIASRREMWELGNSSYVGFNPRSESGATSHVGCVRRRIVVSIHAPKMERQKTIGDCLEKRVVVQDKRISVSSSPGRVPYVCLTEGDL
jgi:hypothetical protein